jgi:hypothetical protein
MFDRLNRLLNWLFPPLPDALADRSRRPPGPWPDLGDVPPLVPAPTIVVVPIIVYAGPSPSAGTQQHGAGKD